MVHCGQTSRLTIGKLVGKDPQVSKLILCWESVQTSMCQPAGSIGLSCCKSKTELLDSVPCVSVLWCVHGRKSDSVAQVASTLQHKQLYPTEMLARPATSSGYHARRPCGTADMSLLTYSRQALMDAKVSQGNYSLIKRQALKKAALNAVVNLQAATVPQPVSHVSSIIGGPA